MLSGADMDELSKPTFSDNLISENRREVKHVVSHPLQQDFNSPAVAFQPVTLTLKRGTLRVYYDDRRSVVRMRS